MESLKLQGWEMNQISKPIPPPQTIFDSGNYAKHNYLESDAQHEVLNVYGHGFVTLTSYSIDFANNTPCYSLTSEFGKKVGLERQEILKRQNPGERFTNLFSVADRNIPTISTEIIFKKL